MALAMPADSRENLQLAQRNDGPEPATVGPLHDPVTWYGINMLGRKLHNGTFKTKELVPVQHDFPLF